MIWGAGPALGLLTLFGYLLFLFGAAIVWRNRSNFLLWVQDEISFFHRSFARYIPAGSFYVPRPESRFRAVPNYVLHSLSRLPRTSIGGGAVLLLVGLLLFALDFYI
jgi:hypothetical protein